MAQEFSATMINRAAEGQVSKNKLYQPSDDQCWAGRHSSAGYCLRFLALFLLGVAPTSSTAAQENPLRREFSANVLMRMGAEKKGVGTRVYIKQDDLYLDFPDLTHGSRIPFWFLSDGLVASLKAATDEDFSPGAANPLLVGTLLRFRAANPDRFCEEFRPYYIGVLTAVAGEKDDQDAKTLQRLQNPENFPCEQTVTISWRYGIVGSTDLPRFQNTGRSYLSLLRWRRSYKFVSILPKA